MDGDGRPRLTRRQVVQGAAGAAAAAAGRSIGDEVAAGRFCETAFEPVETTAMRVEVRLREGWSGGIAEWEVEWRPPAAVARVQDTQA